jgi:nucleoside phosphorylase
MPKEVQYYRKGLTSKLIDYFEGSQLGQIKVQNNNYTIVFPTTNYGRYKTFEKIASLCSQFKDMTTCIFIGCAGGNPEKVNIGDVVISDEIIELFHEKVLLKNEIEKMKGLRISGKLIDISSEAEIELRVEPHFVNNKLVNSAKGLSDKTSQANWSKLVKKYLDFCPDSGDKEKLLLKPPKPIVSKIWSSDHNVNDANLRDTLSKEFGVVAFEMEGGGFAEGAKAFGKRFIEIRGISDYADGIRDDAIRQPLALAVASACAEALIIDILAHT